MYQKDQAGSSKYNEDENLHQDIQSRGRSKSPSRSNKYNRERSSSRDRGLITVKARRANTPRGEAGAGVLKQRIVKAPKVSINIRNTNIRK